MWPSQPRQAGLPSQPKPHSARPTVRGPAQHATAVAHRPIKPTPRPPPHDDATSHGRRQAGPVCHPSPSLPLLCDTTADQRRFLWFPA
jgi:hypothetical protein